MLSLTVLLLIIVYRQLKQRVKSRPIFDKRHCLYTCCNCKKHIAIILRLENINSVGRTEPPKKT